MFRLPFSIKLQEIVNSKLYDEQTFYDRFLKDIHRSKKNITIESPFLTERRALALSKPLKKATLRGVTIKAYTREPSHHDSFLEEQSWKATKVLKNAGVRVFACSDKRHKGHEE